MKIASNHTNRIYYFQGFTLVELMVAMAIIGISLTVAIPSFIETMNDQKLTTQTNDLVASLNLARSTAIKRRQTVTVRNQSGWKYGWDIFVDINNDHINNGDDILIKSYPALESGSVDITGSTGFTGYISYQPNGRAHRNGHFSFCPSNTTEGGSRKVIIANTGRIRTTSGVYGDNCS